MFHLIVFAAALSLSNFAQAYNEEEHCPAGKQHHRATIRHIESGGIGYNNGYTTLEVFLASDPSQWSVTPFLDARGHIFDNGQWAANAGVGLRTLWGRRAYGVNTYYDYRNVSHLNSNQIGVGLETLGKLFDFRINGYLPVGTKISNPYSVAFATFSGNYLLVKQKYQSAMKGANAELGFHFGQSTLFNFYAAAGPYYFVGESAPSIWGGKARISGTFKDILTLEISDSYDRTFHNKFQGQISLGFSFGPGSKVNKQGRTCSTATTLNNRMLQAVDRQEIIVIDKIKKKTAAINPATGLPYFFVFVDNTSSSNGTYESPYHTLLQAQDNSSPNDIIYVFPGDGTTTGMNSGIFLQPNQKFWGSGISHSIQITGGMLAIPAQTSSSPTITNNNMYTEMNAITLATNNAISGFTISGAMNDAIYGADPGSLDVSSCTFEDTTTYTIQATFSGDASISVTGNQFLNNRNGINLTLNGTSTVDCSDNTFIGQVSESEAPIEIVAFSNSFVAHIENNVFTDNVGGSILVTLADVVNADISALDNTFTHNGMGASSPIASSNLAILISQGTVDHCSIALSGNTFTDNLSNSLYLDTAGAFTTLEAVVSENTMSDNHGAGLVFSTPVDTLTLLATNNIITGCQDNGIAVIAAGSSSTGTITINNNTITNIGNNSNAIAVNQGFSALTLTILNNEINGCEGTGISSFPYTGIDSLLLNISGNTIRNCLNYSANAASGICFDLYSSLAATVASNTFIDNISPNFALGFFTPGNPNACLTLTGNNSNTDPSYSLTNPGIGVFNLSPCNVDAVNTGMITTSGSIDSVQSCLDPTPCPP